MRKLEIYLDTSVINFLFADDAPEKRDVTIELFENYIKNNIYAVFISSVVIDEINKTNDNAKKQKLLDVVTNYNLNLLDIEEKAEEIENLAYVYMKENIIPQNKIEDALHISICSVFNIDYLLSWNYRHLANVNKESKIIAVNITEGYNRQLRIITPMDVMYE